MKTIGIIAEYNPFHSGHRYHIQKSKQQIPEETGVVVVMSGHWVQQGNCAIISKWNRAKLALEGGADLVIELPTAWAMSRAQRFAQGAVFLLDQMAVVDYLSFGTEAGVLEGLGKIQTFCQQEHFSQFLKTELKTGCSFPVARQRAVAQALPEESLLLASPNNILALEYLSALSQFQSHIQPMTVARKGSGFHAVVSGKAPEHTSATDLRAKISQGNWDYVGKYVSFLGLGYLQQQETASLHHCERIFLAKIASMTKEDWGKLPDSGEEGLAHLLEKCGNSAQSVEEFLNSAKNKRYTHARLRRLLLCAFLGMKEESLPDTPAYLRVLGMNDKGRYLLKEMKKKAKLPLCTKTANLYQHSPGCQRQFAQEVVYTDLYRLCYSEMLPKSLEWRESPVLDFS